MLAAAGVPFARRCDIGSRQCAINQALQVCWLLAELLNAVVDSWWR